MTASRWRRHARTTIDAILATLPPTATRKDAERALRNESPYSERRSGDGLSWGYQCWLKERRLALNRRWPEKRKQIESPLLSSRGVHCEWCDDRPEHCIGCAAAWTFHASLSPEALALLRGVENREVPAGVWCDFLEDCGLVEWAAQWREAP